MDDSVGDGQGDGPSDGPRDGHRDGHSVEVASPPGRHRWWILTLVLLVTLVTDQITKAIALSHFDYCASSPQLCEPVPLFWTLQIKLAFNTGMAFSQGANAGPIIGVVALLITVAMLWVARSTTSRVQLVSIGLIMGGAIGNVIDRLSRVGDAGAPPHGGFMSGAVVDFIDPQWFPIFNVADSAVVVGGIVLALSVIWMSDDEPDTSGVKVEPDSGLVDGSGEATSHDR